MITTQLIKKNSRTQHSQVVYACLVKELSSSIACGHLAPGVKLPSEQDLAHRFGISRSSVRAGLDILERSGHIIRHAGKGSFVRDLACLSPFCSRVRSLGINVSGMDDDLYGWYDAKIMRTALPCCLHQRLQLGIVDLNQLSQPGFQKPDALILLCYNGGDSPLLQLQSEGVESVLFNRISTHEKLSYVSVNVRHESCEAIRRLQELGHRDIGIIAASTPEEPAFLNPRELGYLDAMGTSAPLWDKVIQVRRAMSEDYYADCIASYLRGHSRSITALFIPNGSLARPTLLACQRLGIRTPDDLTLLCFDDIDYLYAGTLSFHYVKMPLAQMIQDAIGYLSRKLANPNEPVLKKLYPVEILESTSH